MGLITKPVYVSQKFPCTSYTVTASWQHAFKSSVHSAITYGVQVFPAATRKVVLCGALKARRGAGVVCEVLPCKLYKNGCSNCCTSMPLVSKVFCIVAGVDIMRIALRCAKLKVGACCFRSPLLRSASHETSSNWPPFMALPN